MTTEHRSRTRNHAQPDRIRVLVQDYSRDWLRIVIDDDGHGQALPLHYGGLRSLHDRVLAAGGTVEMTSTPVSGTQVTVLLPKEPPHAHRLG